LKQITPANTEIHASKQNWVSLFFLLCHRIFWVQMQTHTPIELQLGTHKGLIEAHLRTYFG